MIVPSFFPVQFFVLCLMFLFSHEQGSGEGYEVRAGEDVERPSQAGKIRASPGRFAKFNSSLSPP